MRTKSQIARIVPDRWKSTLRSKYRTLVRGNDRPSGIAIGEFGRFTVAYRSDTADEEVIEHSFENDIFLPDVPEYVAGPNDTVVDIGAHIGTFALLAASLSPQGRVFAIEASQDSFNLLRVNVALNAAQQVSIHHLALSDTDGEITLYHDSGNWGHSTVKQLSNSSETVAACSLQTFFAKNSIEHCDFMKLNCEGGEFPILMAAPKELLARIDKMLVLFHGDLWHDHSYQDLVAHLESAGFTCDIRNLHSFRGWIVATRP